MKTKLITLLFISLNCAAMNFNYKDKEYSLKQTGKWGVALCRDTDEEINLFQSHYTKENGLFLLEQAQLVNTSDDKSKVIIEIDEVKTTLYKDKPITEQKFNILGAKAKKIIIYDLDTERIISYEISDNVDPLYKVLPSYLDNSTLIRDGYEFFDLECDPCCCDGSYLKLFKHIGISNNGKKALLGNVNTVFLFDFKHMKARELIRKTCVVSEETKIPGSKIPDCFTTINYNDETNAVEIAHSNGTQQIIDLNTENKE